MATMIKLRLARPPRGLGDVEALPGLVGLRLDPRFGVVPINPRDGLYVVRADTVDDLERRRNLSPEILGGYGDLRISPT